MFENGLSDRQLRTIAIGGVIGAGLFVGSGVVIAWEPGDLLLLGSGAAGLLAKVYLGTAASKILRHAPVPVMILPRQHPASGPR